MDDELIQRALLGDKEAQEQATEENFLLPCKCGGNVVIDDSYIGNNIYIRCLNCGETVAKFRQRKVFDPFAKKAEKEIIRDWNNRVKLVVFCKECKYWLKDGRCEKASENILSFEMYGTKAYSVKNKRFADDFCSRGVQKDLEE